jgi:hypothetical protein
MSFREESRKKLLQYLNKLDNREKKEFIRLTIAWQDISSELERLINKLSELENLSEDQLFRLELYKQFLRDSKVVITNYSNISKGIIVDEQKVFAELGLQSAQELLGVGFFNKLNLDAVKFMIGNTKEGTPLFNLLNKSYPETVDRISNTLVESMALGRGPIVTARLLKEDMDGNLNRALLVARTEQLNVFRESQIEQYKATEIVTGLELITEPDACEVCLGIAEGNPYPLDYQFDLHPNCRCGIAPAL